jgi:small subunit ribosomal protein S21
MPEIQVRKGESIDRALKRLKTKLESEGIFDEMRRLRAHETPSERTKRKARNAAKRGKIKFRFSMHERKPAGPAGAPESASA